MDRAGEVEPVMRGRRDIGLLRRLDVIGMEEVEARIFVQRIEQHAPAARRHVVPAHMRQRQAFHIVASGKGAGPPGHPAEPFARALVTAIEEDLHADADAYHGDFLLRHHLVERFTHARCIEQVHRIVERAHAGEHDPLRRCQLRRRLNRPRRNVQALVHVQEGGDIAEAVVDDGDQRITERCRPSLRITVVPRSIKAVLFL
jgi:hypothetical protein